MQALKFFFTCKWRYSLNQFQICSHSHGYLAVEPVSLQIGQFLQKCQTSFFHKIGSKMINSHCTKIIQPHTKTVNLITSLGLLHA